MPLEFLEVPAAELVPLELSQESKDTIRTATKTVQQDLAALPFMLDSDGMTTNFARNVLSVAERNLVELAKLLGVETEAAERIEQRHAEIRRVNLRVHELEGLLGQAQPVEAILPALRSLSEQLKRWWELEGFGHVSEIAYGDYNAKVTFSCSFIGCKPGLTAPEGATPKERKALWLASLEARGFVLLDDDGEKGVVDCAESRAALRALFALRLGNAHVRQFISHEIRGQVSRLWQVEVYIRDLALIRQLPVPEAGAQEVD